MALLSTSAAKRRLAAASPAVADPGPVTGVDWSRVRFTEHMTEAAAVVGECHAVIDFGPAECAAYELKVYRVLKGGGDDPYFAVGTNREDPQGYHPTAGGATPEAALQACLEAAGVYHRRRVKQAGE